MNVASEHPFLCDWAMPAGDVLAAMAGAPTDGAEAALAAALGVPANCLVLGAGIGELVLAMRLALDCAPEQLVMPAAHPWRRLFRGATEVPHRANGHLDVAAMMGMLGQHDAEAVLLGSPDPVTGAALTLPEATLILDACPGALILDGTYHEFAQDQWVQAALHYDRLLVVRPLTLLSHAVPVAYLAAPPAIAAQIKETLPPLPPLLQGVVHAWLSLSARWTSRIEELVQDRQSLYRCLLRAPGVDVLPSQANFLCARGPAALFESLAAAGLPVRRLLAPGPLQDLWQLAVGDLTTNQHVAGRLLEAAQTPA